MQKRIEDFIKEYPGYLKKSPSKVACKLGIDCSYENLATIKQIMQCIRKYGFQTVTNNFQPHVIQMPQEYYTGPNFECTSGYSQTDNKSFELTKEKLTKIALESYMEDGNYDKAIELLNKMKNNNITKSNVLIIGDIHEPFCLEGYLEFCKEQYKKYKCDKVIFIGDIIDQHFSSFHNTDPDGFSAGEELDRAIDKIAKWYEAFPEAIIILGNHDRLAYRKAYAGGVSSRWLRSYGDVLNTPNWKFEEKTIVDNVLYIHGESGTAKMKAMQIGQSVVQGHLHSQAYVEYVNNNIFGMQVGTGINDSLYAFNYNKTGKESILSCAVVLQGTPILIKM